MFVNNRTFAFLSAIALLLVGSCSRSEVPMLQGGTENARRVTVEATWGDSPETRTALQSDGTSIFWSPGDAINLFYGSSTKAKFTTVESMTEPSRTASFEGYLGAATGSSEQGIATQTFWGVYPYDESNVCDGEGVTMTIPSVQKGVPGTFANHLNPSVANSPGLSLSFYNVGSWFMFSFVTDGITSVTLRGNNNEDLVGKIHVTMDASSRPVAEVLEGGKVITMFPEDGGAFEVGKMYYMVLLPQTLAGGYTFTMYKGDTFATRGITSSKTFGRSAFVPGRQIDNGLQWQQVFVDMGDGLEWAAMNVGAYSPEDYGDLYAWGETVPIDQVYANEPDHEFNSPFVDVATEAWGDGCRMPTIEEWQALLDETKFTWTWSSVKKGYTVTSLINNNSIFLPAAGYIGEPELGRVDKDQEGCYWSSTKKSSETYSPAGHLWFADGYKGTDYFSRSVGCSVRAVRAASTAIDDEYVDMGEGLLWATKNLGATVETGYGDYFSWGETQPKDTYSASNYTVSTFQDAATANLGGEWRMPTKDEWAVLANTDKYTWEKETKNSVTGWTVTSKSNGNSIFLPLAGSKSADDTSLDALPGGASPYWSSTEYDDNGAFVIYLASNFWNANSFSPKYIGLPVRPVKGAAIPGHEYVEMGVTSADGKVLKWATCNVGASKPEEYGSYFAWGETTTKTNYAWSTYFDNPSGDGSTFTKYAIDKKTQLDLEDDAARANWGDTWRMPTYAEWEALMNTTNFTWEWTTENEVNGYKVTSKMSGYEGNTLFLPAAGLRNGMSPINGAESYGYYWSSSLYITNRSSGANCVYFESSGVYRNNGSRLSGRSVRPVSE